MTTEQEPIRVLDEEILLNTDQAIRVQALDMSVRSIVPAENFGSMSIYTQKLINRAEMFEDYIKNGVIHDG